MIICQASGLSNTPTCRARAILGELLLARAGPRRCHPHPPRSCKILSDGCKGQLYRFPHRLWRHLCVVSCTQGGSTVYLLKEKKIFELSLNLMCYILTLFQTLCRVIISIYLCEDIRIKKVLRF